MNKRESVFYRETLEQITQDPRKTRARRLAESALMFWDSMQKEAHTREKYECANVGSDLSAPGASEATPVPRSASNKPSEQPES